MAGRTENTKKEVAARAASVFTDAPDEGMTVPLTRLSQKGWPNWPDRGNGKMSIKAVRYDKISYRVMEDGKVVAMANQLSNDRWVLNDLQDRRLSKRTWDSPKDCALEFEVMRTRGVRQDAD